MSDGGGLGRKDRKEKYKYDVSIKNQGKNDVKLFKSKCWGNVLRGIRKMFHDRQCRLDIAGRSGC